MFIAILKIRMTVKNLPLDCKNVNNLSSLS